MINESIKLLATELANKGNVIDYKQNSILNLAEGSIDEIVVRVASAVGNDVSYYKNSLVPFVKGYHDTVVSTVNSRLANIVLADYSISEIEIPVIIQSYMDRNVVGVSDTIVDLPVSMLSIPNPGVVGIKNILRSDNSLIESDTLELLSNFTDDQLMDVWDSFLLNVSKSNDSIAMLRIKAPKNINTVALLLVLVDKLKDATPEGIIGISSSEYKRIMTKFYFSLANTLSYIVKGVQHAVKSKRLVNSVTDKVVYVYGSVYKEYLTKNNVDALFGLAVDDDLSYLPNLYLDSIIINIEKYLTSWEKYIKLQKLSVNEVSLYRNAYSMTIVKTLEDAPESVKKDIVELSIGNVENLISKYVKGLDLSELKDTKRISKDIMTDLVLTNKSFTKFVNSMQNYAVTMENAEPDEAASLATLDLILDYLLEQVTVK